MALLVTIAFIIATIGYFLILELSPFSFLDGIAGYLQPKKKSMRSRIKASKNKKKIKGLRLLFTEVKEILRLTGRSGQFATLCVLAMILFVLGVLIALTMDNTFLVPVLAAGFALLPFYYIKFAASRYRKQINNELETALSMITTSYLRNQNSFIRAVEENLPYLNPPISDLFGNFLMQAKLINANLAESLSGLLKSIDNSVFHEWVMAVTACQEDYNLKNTLPPIVAKLSDMRVVTAELDVLLYEPLKEYITMILLVLGSIPLLYFLNKAWYETLMFTGFGKILLAVCGTVIFISLAAVVKHTRPIEYKR